MKKSAASNTLAAFERDLQHFRLIVFEGLFLGAHGPKANATTGSVDFAQRLDSLGKALDASLAALNQPLQSFLPDDLPSVTDDLTKSYAELCAMMTRARQQFAQIAKHSMEGAELSAACLKLDNDLRVPIHDKSKALLDALNTFVSSSYAIKSKTDNTHINTAIEQIGKIGTMINLIAVNASIEAARAGDSGRGFGVIASEIQVLSQRSKQAVEQLSARLD